MYTVAVVDDDLRQCGILADMIADAPFSSFDIRTFQSVSGLESFQAYHGPVDICLMDVRMDDDAGRFADGIEAVSRLFPEGCGTQVIYVTGYVEYVTPVYETPHVYFLLKPVRAEQLYAALGKALEGKVKKVELTSRLKSHPCCLRAEGPVTLEMEKVLNQQAAVNGGQSVHAERVLELNAEHPIFKKLCALQEGSDKVSTYADILYTQALLIEGMPVDDPVAYANAVCNLLS